MALLFDRGEFNSPKKLPNGFLRADALLTRTGVFTYRMADGSTVRHLRHPDEVFSADSLATLQMVKLTDDHPRPLGIPVTADNVNALAIGTIAADARKHDTFVRGTVQIEDSKIIDSIEGGKKRELSCGYNADYDRTPGVFDGEAYDLIQRNIRYNHVALVDKGRAGPDVKLLLDSDAAIMVDSQPTPEKGLPTMSFKLTLDGVDYTVESQATAQAVQREIERKDAEIAKLKTDTADAKKSSENLQAKFDATAADLAKEVKLRTDAEDPVNVQKLVKARVELEQSASKLIEDAKDIEAMSDAEIRNAVIMKDDPDAVLADRSDDYLECRYEMACKALSAAPATKKMDGVRVAAGSPAVTVDAAEVAKSQAAFTDFSQNGYKTRLNP